MHQPIIDDGHGASPGKSACEPRVAIGCSAVQEHNDYISAKHSCACWQRTA
jgi:hypothetical protein